MNLAVQEDEEVSILAEEAVLKKARVGAQPCPKVTSYSDKPTAISSSNLIGTVFNALHFLVFYSAYSKLSFCNCVAPAIIIIGA